jgi:hypothetical protein
VSAAQLNIAGDTPATTGKVMLYMIIERFKEGRKFIGVSANKGG